MAFVGPSFCAALMARPTYTGAAIYVPGRPGAIAGNLGVHFRAAVREYLPGRACFSDEFPSCRLLRRMYYLCASELHSVTYSLYLT